MLMSFKNALFYLLVALMLVSGQSVAHANPFGNDAQEGQEYAYRVLPGDVLLVSVWDEPDLQGEVVVLPDYQISFPLVGTLSVKELTVSEIADTLRAALQVFIPQANVHVAMQQLRGNKFYVLGKVNRPGEFPMSGRTFVLQALSLAGGLATFADEEGIRVIRLQEGMQSAHTIDYPSLIKGQDLDGNIELRSGDIVVVP